MALYLSADLTKMHSFRLFFGDFATGKTETRCYCSLLDDGDKNYVINGLIYVRKSRGGFKVTHM